MRISPKFLLTLTLFLNDLWYYKFHRKYGPEYPQSTQLFMQKIDLIQELQFLPFFLEEVFPFNDSTVEQTQNEKMFKYLQFNDHDP